ncbi:MAG: GntR family transcriptional regulator [Aggregatilineales bacterium]
MGIDRTSPMPLYYQLKQILLTQIDSGEFKPGDILPTESQIQEFYDVSRTTVRQALSELESEGKVSRYRGRGTFVTKPKISHNPEQYPDLADNMMKQGIVPGWKMLSAEWVAPSEKVMARLQVTATERVFRLKRLRLENDEPIGLQTAYVSPHFAQLIDESAFEEGGSLRYLRVGEILQKGTANRTLEAVPANQEEAKLLNVPSGAAMLLIRRTVLSAENQPIEFFRGVYRGDRFQYHISNMRAISQINA